MNTATEAPPNVPDPLEEERVKARAELREHNILGLVVARVSKPGGGEDLRLVRLPRSTRRPPRRAVHIPRPTCERVVMLGKHGRQQTRRGAFGAKGARTVVIKQMFLEHSSAQAQFLATLHRQRRAGVLLYEL